MLLRVGALRIRGGAHPQLPGSAGRLSRVLQANSASYAPTKSGELPAYAMGIYNGPWNNR